ncbi:hypothetical protein, partial [Primorskyibacter flagellatus]|uniref:hypothetical protein n=1 Tax=Primorskyibacter flagellatus TaxID=1387277 RepID=UPI001C4E1466
PSSSPSEYSERNSPLAQCNGTAEINGTGTAHTLQAPILWKKSISQLWLADDAQGMEAAWPRSPQAGSVHNSPTRRVREYIKSQVQR